MKKVILFDLDGTLMNTKEGITKCAAYALKHYGIHVEDLDSLDFFIGPPLHMALMRKKLQRRRLCTESVTEISECMNVNLIPE